LFFSLKAVRMLRTNGFLLSRPSSSSTLLISCGSIVPLPSSSKTKKTSLKCSYYSGLIRSFHATGGVVLVVLTWLVLTVTDDATVFDLFIVKYLLFQMIKINKTLLNLIQKYQSNFKKN
jgi:hypothetical protein